MTSHQSVMELCHRMRIFISDIDSLVTLTSRERREYVEAQRESRKRGFLVRKQTLEADEQDRRLLRERELKFLNLRAKCDTFVDRMLELMRREDDFVTIPERIQVALHDIAHQEVSQVCTIH